MKVKYELIINRRIENIINNELKSEKAVIEKKVTEAELMVTNQNEKITQLNEKIKCLEDEKEDSLTEKSGKADTRN